MHYIYNLKRISILAFCALLFTQCTSTRTIAIDTLRPAAISFPSNIKSMLILDRTHYEHRRDEYISDVLGGIPGEDKAALQGAMASLNQTLMQSPRFKVQMATEIFNGNSLTNAFPYALGWDEIKSLCTEYNTDAVISFEVFGTNFVVTRGDRRVKKQIKNEKGVMVEREVVEYFAKGIGNIRMGIRVYDPTGMTIIDQQLFTQSRNWEATGGTREEAYIHLIQQSDATRQIAARVAGDYAYKIAPMPIKLYRDFYSKSKKVPQVTQGAQKARVNDWQGALNTWQGALKKNTPRKQAGWLCYNIAVAYEVLGDLTSAQKAAARSYVDFGNKRAGNYAEDLAARIADENRVDQQMK